MLKQIIEFSQKAPENVWGEERLKTYLEKSKRRFFFVVITGDNLVYKDFNIVGIENPFLGEAEMSELFINLEEWMEKNRNMLEYTDFERYRKPLGGNNYALGSASGLGTQCLSHFELQNIGEDTLDKAIKEVSLATKKDALFHIRRKKVKAHVNAIDDQTLNEHDINRESLKNLYDDFLDDLFERIPEKILEQVSEGLTEAEKKELKKKDIFKHDVIISDKKLLGVKQVGKTTENKNTASEMPKYFNVQKADKKPFVITSRTRPDKRNMLISENENRIIQRFIDKLLPDIGTPFILPLEERLQNKMAENIRLNEKNFFKTIEIIFEEAKVRDGKFDFYFVDIRGKKIQFFDYVSNYQYNFPEPFYQVFPPTADKTALFGGQFNRRNLNEFFSKLFDQKSLLSCLPWADVPDMNLKKKSAYIQIRDKMFETLYLGKKALTDFDVKNLCLLLIEDCVVNQNHKRVREISNNCLNFFANHNLYTLVGKTSHMDKSPMEKAEEIRKQVDEDNFKPVDKESGFYLLGLLLRRLCDKSETSSEKSRLLQPIIHVQNIFGLNRAVTSKFVEKYAYKIDTDDIKTQKLMNEVLPFFAEQNGEESIRDFKLWLYAGFFSS